MSEIFDFIDEKYKSDEYESLDVGSASHPMRVKIQTADCMDALSSIESNFIDACITDPPYGVNINPRWDKGMPSEEVWNECERALKPGSHCIIFGQPSKAQDFFTIMANTKLEYRDTWIWAYQGTHTKGYKTEDSTFRSKIRNIYNPIYVYRKALEGSEEENWRKHRTNLLNIRDNRQQYKGNHASITKKYETTGQAHLQSDKKSNTFKKLERKGWVPGKGAEPTNIQYVPRATKAERTMNGVIKNPHETVKPIALMLWLVGLATSDNSQIVLDPFQGTGTTGCACRLLNRKYIGIDDDPAMADIALGRIEEVYSLDESLFKRRAI